MRLSVSVAFAALGLWALPGMLAASSAVPPTSAKPGSTQTAVLAGGCFWGVEAVFERVRGVSEVVSGYAGGSKASADYQQVSAGTTDHAEAVKITYDPKVVSYAQLLSIYFSVAHDPTELNRQGPDVGRQYRSAIFFATPSQQTAARASIATLRNRKVFPRPIVTQVVPLQAFYSAEAYHQNYIAHNPFNPYVVVNDLPKLAQLKRQFPQLLK
jgi:peptide-methionine (S)-S-oxide reductase